MLASSPFALGEGEAVHEAGDHGEVRVDLGLGAPTLLRRADAEACGEDAVGAFVAAEALLSVLGGGRRVVGEAVAEGEVGVRVVALALLVRSGSAVVLFTGSVYVDTIAAPGPDSRIGAASVHFTPGARTAWHTHPHGETIWVTEGLRLCQREGGPIEVIRPGDRVFSEPGKIGS